MTASGVSFMLASIPPRPAKEVQQIRVAIAERDRMSSQLLAESLERDSQFRVVASPSIEELISVATVRKPDVAVISADFASNVKKGLQVARVLSVRFPSIRVVLLLDSLARESVLASFRSGARGVFCRTEPVCEFRACVEHVSRGEIWARGTAAEYLVEAVRNSPSCDAIEGHLGMLSKREIEVVEHAVQGQTNRQIAGQLRLSEHTVKNYLFRIFEKLGVSSRTELLFLLSAHNKEAVLLADPSARGNNSLEEYLRAAEEGWVSAQFIVGLEYFKGRAADNNQQSAYYWLRMAEENSSRLREHTCMLIQELKARMKLEDIEELEKTLITKKDKMLFGKRLADFSSEDPSGAAPLLVHARIA
jgi:two-component system, NarL family, nitrate/nitrite response regulator NarL